VVQPVSLVDSDIVLSVSPSTFTLDLAFTAGAQAAPAINTVLADSGPLTAGVYNVFIMLGVLDPINAAAPTVAVQRRNAANAANIWEQRFYCSSAAGATTQVQLVQQIRMQVQEQERVRLINLTAGGAGSVYDANIWVSV